MSEPECIVREPEYIVREPESNYKGVGARNQWLLGVESESMTGVMGWSVEPEAMVAEPGVMGVNHRGYDVGARGYDRSYGMEPEAMV